MGSVTSAVPGQRQEPILRRMPFAGGTLVTTQMAPSASRKLMAGAQCIVRFSESSVVIDRRNAAAAIEFAGYLAKQAKAVLDGRSCVREAT